MLQKYGAVATNFLFIIGAKFQFTVIEQGFLTKRRMVQVGSRYIYNMFKKWRNNTMREKAIRINILALIAFILISSFALPVGTSHAASTTFINDIAEKYEALEDEFTKQYKADLKTETNHYELFLEKTADEQKKLEKLLDEDLEYLDDLLDKDYKALVNQYGDDRSYNSKLTQYKNQINPSYSTGALWKYSKEIDKNYSTSLHWKFNNQINPNYSTSMMWKYKNEINPSYSTSTMWKYANTVNSSYSTSIMWKLRNESNPNYSTSTMWKYKQGNITQEQAKKSMDSILKTGKEDLQAERDSAMNSIKKLRERTMNDIVDLRNETVRKILKQRSDSLEDISDLRERLFGSGIEAKALVISFDSIKVIIDGELQQFEQPPFVVNGTTLVPMRAIFERLGANVEWNQAQRSVKATKGNTTIQLAIGSNMASKNGENVKLDVAAQTKNNHTMVPLRFISEALGANVMWDGKTSTVTITTK